MESYLDDLNEVFPATYTHSLAGLIRPLKGHTWMINEISLQGGTAQHRLKAKRIGVGPNLLRCCATSQRFKKIRG